MSHEWGFMCQVEIYLNRPEVQKALHANTTNLSWRWTDCRLSSVILDSLFIVINNLVIQFYGAQFDQLGRKQSEHKNHIDRILFPVSVT